MAGALAFNGVAFGVIPYLSIWMQTVLGMSPVRGGLTLLPLTGATMVVAILAGKLLHGVPARLTIGGGLLLVGSGAFCQAVLDAGTSWTVLVPGLVLVGIGTGFVSPAIAGAALAAVPPERAGMAGGAVNTVRQLGYALGVAVFGTVLTSRMQDTLSHDAAHTLAAWRRRGPARPSLRTRPAGRVRLGARLGVGGGGRDGDGRRCAGTGVGADAARCDGHGRGTGEAGDGVPRMTPVRARS